MRSITPVAENSNQEEAALPATPVKTQLRKIELTDGFYAVEESKSIKIYSRDNVNLFGLNPDNIDFDERPLNVCLQVYLMAWQQGRAAGYEHLKKKIEDMMKLVL